MFLLISIGATIAAFQSVDYLKQPLLDSLKNYNPESPAEEKQGITQAWDDVQKEVQGIHIISDHVENNGILSSLFFAKIS